MIGPHSEVKGRNEMPGRIIVNFETPNVRGESTPSPTISTWIGYSGTGRHPRLEGGKERSHRRRPVRGAFTSASGHVSSRVTRGAEDAPGRLHTATERD